MAKVRIKLCRRCNTQKDISEFHKRKKAKDGTQHACKICHRSDMRLRMWKKAGIIDMTHERYEQMVQAQGGCCALCDAKPKVGNELAVDHDHETGLARKLLCIPCNVALDRPDRVKNWFARAQEYLAEHAPIAP